jgi:ABC-2 type transport system permease protein
MQKPYSQFTAMMAIARASFQAQMKSPMAFVFSFFFPLFFILIFGSSRNNVPGVRIAIDPASDTSNAIYHAIKNHPNIGVNPVGDMNRVRDSLEKGRIAAIIKLSPDSISASHVAIQVQSSLAAQDRAGMLHQLLYATMYRMNLSGTDSGKNAFATIKDAPLLGSRKYKQIDFVLPGQLGFSLLSAGLFGLAFLFFGLRETLVLKRLNATPIGKPYIIFGEALARIFFQMIIISVIILIGKYSFGFTLVKGAQTFVELLLLSFVGLAVFMGFGFVISGLSKSMNSVPVFTNLLGFPQFMLSGTFFPYEGLPKFLHPICKALPLTHLNTALRKVSFEGLGLGACLPELGILAIWAVILYGISFKVFKWE